MLDARVNRSAITIVFVAALIVAGCSGKSTPCNEVYVGSAGAISGVLISPASGATGVPNSFGTLVFNGLTDYQIVLEAIGGSSTAPIETTPTALPSPYTNPSPGPGTGTNGYYAVSVPLLNAATTYAAGTLSDANRCAGDEQFYQFGTFTTR